MYNTCNTSTVNLTINAVQISSIEGSCILVAMAGRWFGYSLSSNEATWHKQSMIENENDSDWLNRMMRGSFCHWVEQDVDHNIGTFDGKETLHAMGIVMTTTGPNVYNQDLPNILRNKLKNVGKLLLKKGISSCLMFDKHFLIIEVIVENLWCTENYLYST